MRQPEGMDDRSGKVCCLKRALYGLKQSSRVWNDKLNDVLVNKLKFQRSSIDQCIYHRRSQQNIIILAVWVDDIMIFANRSTSLHLNDNSAIQHDQLQTCQHANGR